MSKAQNTPALSALEIIDHFNDRTAIDVFATVAAGDESFKIILQSNENGDYWLGSQPELDASCTFERMVKTLGY
jgi:hypothetical protein